MCGVLALLGHENVSPKALLGLWSLQHRGQDACGLSVYDPKTTRILTHKGAGAIAQVFAEETHKTHKGPWALGHTRYPTAGGLETANIQPLVTTRAGGMALAFNGNISNFQQLRQDLCDSGEYFSSTSDGEIILKILSAGDAKENFWVRLQNNVSKLFEQAQGAMASAGLQASQGMFAFADPLGLRPLFWGKNAAGNFYAVASESSTLDLYDLAEIHQLLPGQLIYIDGQFNFHEKYFQVPRPAPCMFEWVYFSNPQSVLSGQSIYKTRMQLGHRLGEKIKRQRDTDFFPIDYVVPIPDSGRIAAAGVAEFLKIPLRESLIKNRYVQRSFIGPCQKDRERVLQLKLAPVRELIEDKHLLLVDDSIVRGSTGMRISRLLRSFGAASVTLAVSCPPVRYPCFYGIDFPSQKELAAAQMKGPREMAKLMELDHVIYLDLEDLQKTLPCSSSCTGCLTGKYPTTLNAPNGQPKGPTEIYDDYRLPLWQ